MRSVRAECGSPGSPAPVSAVLRPPPLQWVSVLYGRYAEISALDEVIAQAHHGCGGAVVLRGEAGAGKTALLLSRACRRRWAWAACPRTPRPRCWSPGTGGWPPR
ncbi:ATP-binding protein [Streptomyces sp. NRRL S-4]|uniref:ATP-binding protein n=1 Tax=Streptomyces sp. NRRL S-4 TaxID=1519471 RepID=UPI001F26AD79|nr:ATP-binding protein [Streptomyces sp. NRRL S-4]